MDNGKRNMKQKWIVGFSGLMLLLAGCGELKDTADKAAGNIEDVVQSAATSMDPNVQAVKEGYLQAYPDILIGDAFETYFSSSKWKYFPAEDGQEVVEFTGYFLYEDVEAKANIQFLLLDEGGFEVGAVSYNDLPQNQLSKIELLDSIFEETAVEETELAEVAEENQVNQEAETTEESEPNGVAGQLDMPIPIGGSLDVLINHYGEPTYDDYFMGGRLVVFEEKDGYFLDDNETITGYMISNPYISIYNAYIGMTLDEISTELSEPVDTFFDESETQSYVNVYYIENYKISFYAEAETGPTTSAIIIANDMIANADEALSDPYEWTPGFQQHFEDEVLERGYVDSLDTIRYEKAYVDNGEGYLQLYGMMDGTEFAIVKVNVKTGDFTGL